MRTCGFTLLELMVAMTLLALIGVMAAGGIGFGTAVWARGAAVAEEAATTRAVAKLLRRLLADARPIRLSEGRRDPAVLFEADPRAMLFVAPLPAAIAPPGDHLVALAVEDEGSTRRLVLYAAALGEGPPDLPAGTVPELLLDGLASAGFAYLDVSEDDDARPVWVERWTGRARLPARVAVTLTWPEDAARAPLRLVARPRGVE